MKEYLKDLNENQYKAATTLDGPLLLLAGAGSGKTKTIISRTLNLIDNKNVPASKILVMTFTNKAAREMKERGQKIIGDQSMPEFTTFHSWGVRFLKTYGLAYLGQIGLTDSFSIIGTDEQEFILNNIKMDVFKEAEAKKIKINKFLLTLGTIQNNLVRFDSEASAFEDISQIYNDLDLSMFEDVKVNVSVAQLSEIFVSYKNQLVRSNSVDFEDLINYPIKLISENIELKELMHDQYEFIMVDEFQDTNDSQLALLNNILNSRQNICVVGDDSQSIYGWRGADISHILNFHKTYKNCTVVNLSTNYRSSQQIVEKANQLLKHATEKHSNKVNLDAFKKSKGEITSKLFYSAKEEADAIAKSIKRLMLDGETGFSVLYRTPLVSRALEVSFISYGVPYNIHNGKTLLERKVAQTIISYFKFLQDNSNEIALSLLLINSNIFTNDRSLVMLKESRNSGQTLFDFLKSGNYKIGTKLQKATIIKIEDFLKEVAELTEIINNENYFAFIEEFFTKNVVKNVYEKMLEKEDIKDEKIIEAESNLRVISMIKDLSERYTDLRSFLETISLEGEESDVDTDKVNLMTVHASKGLEFENVYIIGAVEGVFPSERTVKNNALEEERRLFYVAITRAKHRLFVSGAQQYYGNQAGMQLTRFAKEANISK